MNWFLPITLHGKFLSLEPLTPNHAELMFLHFEDRVTEYLARGGETIASVAALRQHLDELIAIPNRLNWAVVLTNGDVAGRISFSEINIKNNWLEIGTMLMPKFWGSAANPESKLLLMARAFEILGVNRVQFKVDSRNQRSKAAMQKLGAVEEGTLRQFQVRADGFVRDSIMFSVLKNEWPSVRENLKTKLDKM